MFHFSFKFHKDTVLKVFALQECFAINGAVEEPWEAQIPHQVFDVLPAEEIFVEILCEVVNDGLKQLWLCIEEFLSHQGERPMEHAEVGVKLLKHLMEKLRIFFLEE